MRSYCYRRNNNNFFLLLLLITKSNNNSSPLENSIDSKIILRRSQRGQCRWGSLFKSRLNNGQRERCWLDLFLWLLCWSIFQVRFLRECPEHSIGCRSSLSSSFDYLTEDNSRFSARVLNRLMTDCLRRSLWTWKLELWRQRFSPRYQWEKNNFLHFVVVDQGNVSLRMDIQQRKEKKRKGNNLRSRMNMNTRVSNLARLVF